MRTSKETENAGPTPEQLLLILDAQLSAQRSHRAGASRNRATILVVGVLLIVAVASAALMVLSQMVSDLRDRGVSNSSDTPTQYGNF